MFKIGDKVKIKAPFNATFNGVYTVIALAEATDTYTVDVMDTGSDFYITYLEAA